MVASGTVYRGALLTLGVIVVLAVPAASAQAANVSGDFNGDGRSDLAVASRARRWAVRRLPGPSK